MLWLATRLELDLLAVYAPVDVPYLTSVVVGSSVVQLMTTEDLAIVALVTDDITGGVRSGVTFVVKLYVVVVL